MFQCKDILLHAMLCDVASFFIFSVLSSASKQHHACCRQKYAALVPATATEGILCTENGQLLEGFISNLFVVQQNAAGLVVMTATEGVLAGLKQKEVLIACEALGIPTACKAPIERDRHLWTEAFLTNAVKGLRSIKCIVCPAENAIGWEPWICHLPDVGPQSVYARVHGYLQEICEVDVMQF